MAILNGMIKKMTGSAGLQTFNAVKQPYDYSTEKSKPKGWAWKY